MSPQLQVKGSTVCLNIDGFPTDTYGVACGCDKASCGIVPGTECPSGRFPRCDCAGAKREKCHTALKINDLLDMDPKMDCRTWCNGCHASMEICNANLALVHKLKRSYFSKQYLLSK